jgi:hypothetical protein
MIQPFIRVFYRQTSCLDPISINLPSTQSPSSSTTSPLYKSLLHLPNLSLELLNLLPAVQRPTVILPQARTHILTRLLDRRRDLLQLLARLKLGLQVHDLLLHAGVAASGVRFRRGSGGLAGAVVLIEGRGQVGGESVRIACGLLLGHGVGLDVGSKGRGEVGELFGAGVADARELVVDAGLDLELEVLGTRAVGLVEVLIAVSLALVYCWWWCKHLWI